MELSIFSDDGNLGDVGGNRVVVIAGNGTDNTLIGVGNTDLWFKQQIEAAMASGRIGASVRAWKTGSTVNFEVEVDTLPQHTNEQVRRMVQTAIDAQTYTYYPINDPIFGGLGGQQTRRALSNVSTYIKSGDDRTTATNPGATRPPNNNPPGNSPPTPSSNTTGLPSVDLTSLGLGVVGGGTIALLVVGLVLLKK